MIVVTNKRLTAFLGSSNSPSLLVWSQLIDFLINLYSSHKSRVYQKKRKKKKKKGAIIELLAASEDLQSDKLK